MWEHRLIEQMVGLLRGEIDRITSRKTVDVILIEQAVDFFRTYADRTHHGKEERSCSAILRERISPRITGLSWRS
jgi:hemerythrin-like domain-containing protein